MNRLTFEGNFCDIAQCRENPCPYNGSCSQREVWEKLKAYEDTGMEPEEIKPKRGLPPVVGAALDAKADHMRDLLKAEREGRLMVLPCKVSQTVYFILEDLPSFYPETDGWYISESEVSEVCTRGFSVDPIDKDEKVLFYPYSDIGKTVFLTREEAEAALKKKEA